MTTYITITAICAYCENIQNVRVSEDKKPEDVVFWARCSKCGRYELQLKAS